MPLRWSSLHFIGFALVLTAALSCLYLAPPASRAESIQIFATVAVDEFDFQLDLTGPEISGPVGPDSVLTYHLTYGSYLKTPTDMIVLRVTWSQGALSNGQTTDLLEYVTGSATDAVGGAKPTIDIVNRTITWQITPLPPGTDLVVSWQLRTKSPQLSELANFTIAATLIGPDVEKQATPLTYGYLYTAAPAEPSPPSTPNPTLAPTLIPGVEPPDSVGNILEQLGPLITNLLEVVEEMAQNGGSLMVAPIPILLVLIPALTHLTTILGQVPWWQITPLLMALFWAQPKKAWGVVFDSQTKQPIDPAIITLTDSSGHKRSTISDFYGRYQFLVEPGTYELIVQKTHYTFPSDLLKGRQTDGVYDDLYFGGQISVDAVGVITFNIPMDKAALDWNQRQYRSGAGLDA